MSAGTLDVIVVGGGPAGLSAAEAAARGGASVLLLEQHKEIGSPLRTTGGSFIPELKALGIPERFLHPVRRCRFIAPNRTAQFDYDDPEFCVMDVKGVYQFLAGRAITAGAVLRLGTRVTGLLQSDGRVEGVRAKNWHGQEHELRASLVVDASGYAATLLKAAGVHPGARRFGVGAEYDLFAPNYDTQEAVLIVGNQVAPSGYAWFCPWGDRRVRAGVGIIHPDSLASPEAYLDDLIRQAGRFGVNLAGAQPIEVHLGMMPSDGPMESIVGEGILGVGDSAGQPSALVGEGIRWCIEAGLMAGEMAAEAVRDRDVSKAFLQRYEDRWNRKHGRNLRIAQEINRRIARYDDAAWDERTEQLASLSPSEFLTALKTDFSLSWAAQTAVKHPTLLVDGLKSALFRRRGQA